MNNLANKTMTEAKETKNLEKIKWMEVQHKTLKMTNLSNKKMTAVKIMDKTSSGQITVEQTECL